jgi:outer membrane protein OmpA-like peptidoglycan-associated protein
MRISILPKTSLIVALASAGCATAAPPPDLLAARASYSRVEHGTAAKLDPADLHTARETLDAAEQSYAKNGDTQETRDLAYTAERRAQIAEARANAAQSTQGQQQTLNDMHANEATQMKATSAQLGRANKQLAVQGQAIETKDQQLVAEREARAAAEKRAAQAAADLAKFASVKQETRGLVITLTGGVLFASGKSELLPSAQVKLNSVAEALTQQDPDSKMVVEGHTDSQGGVSYNQGLSERRAQTVRDYLVSRGIAADRVTSQGFGSSRSVADNNSAEGRANNRRVEIVVAPTAVASTIAQAR